MYCKNCGNTIESGAEICVKCGYRNGTGNRYCQNCGKDTAPGQAVCLNCGCLLSGGPVYKEGEQKSRMTAGLLALFCGGFGVHNFYLGYTGEAVGQLLLSCTGISLVWAIIDTIQIFTHKINKDAKGIPLAD